jgi:ribonuclease HI
MPKAPRVTPQELARIRNRVRAHGGTLAHSPCPRPGCHATVVLDEEKYVCLTCGWLRATTQWKTKQCALSAAIANAGSGDDFRALMALVDPKRAKKLSRHADAAAHEPRAVELEAPVHKTHHKADKAPAEPVHPVHARSAAGEFVPHHIPTLGPDAPRVLIYTDGGCEPNPGPGGWGAILWTEGVELELAGGARKTTNNRMEITAALEGLRALVRPSRVTVITDSQYLSNGMTDWITAWSKAHFRRKGDLIPNHELWEALARAALAHETSWAWTRGHSGQPENERCDRLAAAMIDDASAGAEAPSHRERRERHGRLPHVNATETTTIWLAP